MNKWIRAHKRILIHSSIICAFLLYAFFLADPLFDMFEYPDPTLSKLCQISLPSETNNINYSIDRLATIDPLAIYGWAFIGGQSAENCKNYVVLKSKDNTYVYTTSLFPRPDVSASYKYTDLNLDNSGFRANIPVQKLKGGTYRIGLYIEKGDIKAFRFTDQLLIKSDETVEQVYLTSTLQDISIPATLCNMESQIDFLQKLTKGNKEYIEIIGWAFVQGRDVKNNWTYVVLKSDSDTYIFNTDIHYTPWVTRYFESLKMDLDWSGFRALIPTEQIKDGKYKLGIYIKSGDIKFLQYTAENITF